MAVFNPRRTLLATEQVKVDLRLFLEVRKDESKDIFNFRDCTFQVQIFSFAIFSLY